MSLLAPPSSLWSTYHWWYRSLVLCGVEVCPQGLHTERCVVVIVMSKNNIEGLMAAKDLPVGLASHSL